MERKPYFKFLVLTGAALLAAGAARTARAQDPDDLKRGVARISLMDGDVSVKRGDSGEWVAGVINAPLMTDDRIATGANSRTEVQFDSANLLRLGGNGEIHLARLESGTYQIEIARGTVTYRVLRASSANVELNTPSVSVRPAKEGTYRVTVNDAGESEITARAGDVEVFTPKGSQWVYSGQTMMARGSAADPEFQMVSAIPYDDWDRWNDSRDHAFLQSNSYQYVPQGVYGAEDLDNAGSWSYVEPYGYCWTPTVVVGWAPYRYGRWAWLDWYGWSWISYDPWGWAPYHYGRWFWRANFGWSWYPGVFGVRSYWSPALVGFFGFGHGGVGFGFGNIGWVPLAPFETFHPWWGRGFNGRGGAFNQNLNITNINVSNIYRNARVANGISAVNAEEFRNGQFGRVQRLSGQQVGQAGLIRGPIGISPTEANRRFSDHAVTNIPRSADNTRFFSRQAGNVVQTGRPAGQGTGVQNEIRPSGTTPQAGYHRFGEPGVPQNTRPSNLNGYNAQPARTGGIRAFGEPGSTNAVRNDRPPSAQGGNGSWRSFGTPGSTGSAPRQPYNPPAQQYRGNPGSSQPPARQSTPAPSYSAPRQSAPSYSAPHQSAPSYSAPHSAPSGGGGHPASSGGGHSGGGHSGGHR